MKKKIIVFLILGYVLIFFSNCSYSSWYEGLRNMERKRCSELEDSTERFECMDKINEMSYDQYQKEREAAKNQ